MSAEVLWVVATKDDETLFGPFRTREAADAFRAQFGVARKWARVRTLIVPEGAS